MQRRVVPAPLRRPAQGPPPDAFPLLDLPTEVLRCVLDWLAPEWRTVRRVCRALCAVTPVPHAAIYCGLVARAYCLAAWSQVVLLTSGDTLTRYRAYTTYSVVRDRKLARPEFEALRHSTRAVLRKPKSRAELDALLMAAQLRVTPLASGGASLGLALRVSGPLGGDRIVVGGICRLSADHMKDVRNSVPFLLAGPLGAALTCAPTDWPVVYTAPERLAPPADWAPHGSPPDRPPLGACCPQTPCQGRRADSNDDDDLDDDDSDNDDDDLDDDSVSSDE